MIIVNMCSGDKYCGRFQLTRTGNNIVWLYIIGTSLEIKQRSYLSLQKNITNLKGSCASSGDSYLYLDFEESDLDNMYNEYKNDYSTKNLIGYHAW